MGSFDALAMTGSEFIGPLFGIFAIGEEPVVEFEDFGVDVSYSNNSLALDFNIPSTSTTKPVALSTGNICQDDSPAPLPSLVQLRTELVPLEHPLPNRLPLPASMCLADTETCRYVAPAVDWHRT